MLEEYQNLLNEARKNRKSIRKKTERLRKMRKGIVDGKIHPLHEEAFEKIDCLACANCCKTTGPLFTTADIERIAYHLKLSAAQFINDYLRLDEDNDYVLQSVPCTFLDSDNYCSIYEVRPKACREYPHTDRINQAGILKLTEKNSQICPAVAQIFQKLEI
jgi:Fe-S-cluster containining protein